MLTIILSQHFTSCESNKPHKLDDRQTQPHRTCSTRDNPRVVSAIKASLSPIPYPLLLSFLAKNDLLRQTVKYTESYAVGNVLHTFFQS